MMARELAILEEKNKREKATEEASREILKEKREEERKRLDKQVNGVTDSNVAKEEARIKEVEEVRQRNRKEHDNEKQETYQRNKDNRTCNDGGYAWAPSGRTTCNCRYAGIGGTFRVSCDLVFNRVCTDACKKDGETWKGVASFNDVKEIVCRCE
jgi:hypothetical protein